CGENRLQLPELRPDGMDALMAFDWPGNVRQLRNTVQSICVLGQRGPVNAAMLEQVLGGRVEGRAPAPATTAAPGAELEAKVMEAERKTILETLEATEWNREEAARRLGMSRTTLYNRMLRYSITRP